MPIAIDITTTFTCDTCGRPEAKTDGIVLIEPFITEGWSHEIVDATSIVRCPDHNESENPA